MTTPPPDPFQSWPPPPPAAGPNPGDTPPGQPFGVPPGPYPGWPPAGPPKNNALKWILGIVAMVAVIAVAVTVTVVVLHGNPGDTATAGGTGTGSGGTGGGAPASSQIASANDTGPVTIITDEPTCDRFIPISNAIGDKEREGWSDSDHSIPATAWSDEQRSQFQSVATAMRSGADQMVALAKQTPHRVVRELYEQSIAYARAYADAIPNYTAHDDFLSQLTIASTSTIAEICNTITEGSAATRAILVTPPPAPSKVAPVGDPANPRRFLTSSDPICPVWMPMMESVGTASAAWAAIPATIPATEWTPDQKETYDAAARMFLDYSHQAESLTGKTENQILQDFLSLYAQYQSAYSGAIPTYVSADGFIYNVSHVVSTLIFQACNSLKA